MSTLPNNLTTDVGPMPLLGATITDAAPCVKRWNREEYYKLDEQGWFLDQRTELIDGEILLVSPQSFGHSYAIHSIFQLLSPVFAADFTVRMQMPLNGSPFSEPEPDISVVRGTWQDYSDHPTTALLIVEVSKTSLNFDKTAKLSLYASMGVPDYWVLDLENRQLFVYRQPVSDDRAPFGHRYEQTETIAADGYVSPLEKPEAKLAVAEMLPPVK